MRSQGCEMMVLAMYWIVWGRTDRRTIRRGSATAVLQSRDVKCTNATVIQGELLEAAARFWHDFRLLQQFCCLNLGDLQHAIAQMSIES